jgi:hypothetical protein
MSPMTHALISYWQRLPAESPVVRRKALEATRERVRAARESPAALVPFALGDVDEEIVAPATQAYVAAVVPEDGQAPANPAALDEVTEWVRRGLAINRGAVFGALLALEDGRIEARLGALRLGLSATEIEVAGRALGPVPGPRATAFLASWLDFIADGPLERERRVLSSLLGAGCSARAA